MDLARVTPGGSKPAEVLVKPVDEYGDTGDDPVPVRAGLERFFRFLGAPPVDVVTRLEASWADLVGPVLAEASSPLELRDGVLLIGCDDAAWVAQVSWMEPQIKDHFSRAFPNLELRRVVARTRKIT